MTYPHQEIDELVRQADDSERQERQRHAAFLYERARRLALDAGDHVRAFEYGRKELNSWSLAGEDVRKLNLLLELSTSIPMGVDPVELYRVRYERFEHLRLHGPLAAARAVKAETDALYQTLVPAGPDIAYTEACLLARQGRFEDAYEQFEIAWARHGDDDHVSQSRSHIAGRAARLAVRLRRFDEARRWIDLIQSPYWVVDAALHRHLARMLLGLRLGDARAARTALADFDAAATSVQRLDVAAAPIDIVVGALTLDESFGDPQQETHPTAARVSDFPAERHRSPLDHQSWTRAVLARRLAALRYATGIPPDEDYFGEPPPPLRARPEERLPGELASRVAACRDASDDAMSAAERADELFECDWNRREVANLRLRIDEIAARHRL